MNNADAGMPSGFHTPEEIIEAIQGPRHVTVRAAVPQVKLGERPAPVASPASEPEPVDDRPLEALEREEADRRERVNDLMERRLRAAARISELDQAIEEARRASFDPEATLEARTERARQVSNEDELDKLVEIADADHERAARALTRAHQRIRGDELRASLAAVFERAAASDAELEAATAHLLDVEEERRAIIADTERLRADLASVPAEVRGVVPIISAVYLDPDRLVRFRHPTRRRLWTFGL